MKTLIYIIVLALLLYIIYKLVASKLSAFLTPLAGAGLSFPPRPPLFGQRAVGNGVDGYMPGSSPVPSMFEVQLSSLSGMDTTRPEKTPASRQLTNSFAWDKK
jgi:hypothetical protein